MKKFKTASLLSLLFILASCEDFTQKNIEVATPPKQEVNTVDLLLGETSRINSGEFSIEKLLANTGSFVTEPLVQKLKREINDLNSAVNQHCSSLGVFTQITSEQLSTLRKPIQENWKKAMRSYHQLAMMSYGPATDITSTFFDSLYTFDGEEKCRLDANLFQVSERGVSRLPRLDVINNYNVRGLDTLEPLFFADPNKTRCTGRVNPRIAKWFEGPLLEREKVVCTYAQHLLKDMTVKASELAKQWSPQQGHFTAVMLRGGAGSPIELVNQISQSLFSLDTNTKDVKLAFPAGFEVRIDGTVTKCPDATCPNKREHIYANFALDALEASVEGFRMLFLGLNPETGVNGNGFDDLLSNRGHGELAVQMTQNTNDLLKNIQALKEKTTLGDALKLVDPVKCEETTSENRLEEVCALVWDIRKVSNLLKNEYLSALQELSAPGQAQGDAD